MTSTLAKKLKNLEAEYWSKAKCIEKTNHKEIAAILKALLPLHTPLFNLWLHNNTYVNKLNQRAEEIEKRLPPLHPAFLPDYVEGYRLNQWAMYHSEEYRKLTTELWAQFIEHVNTHYDLAGGILGIALVLFEKDLDQCSEDHAYMGRQANREAIASDFIALWRCFMKLSEEADDPQDRETRDKLWKRAVIENIRALYGREMTEAELDFDAKMWNQLREDMTVGKPASESEAAAYLRDLFERFPRKV